MSLEGGLEEVVEFFLAAAKAPTNWVFLVWSSTSRASNQAFCSLRRRFWASSSRQRAWVWRQRWIQPKRLMFKRRERLGNPSAMDTAKCS